MLALRLVLTEAPGHAAVRRGRRRHRRGSGRWPSVGALARLGQRHQVLVVTHLAQVAAFAEHQIVVDKRERRRRAPWPRPAPVDGEDRVVELARMLSGLSGSGSARRHAARAARRRPTRRWRHERPDGERAVVQSPRARSTGGRRTWSSGSLPGEIAVIDHADLDRVAADGLVDADAAAVLNAATSFTGRYPNLRPAARGGSRHRARRRRRRATCSSVLADGDIVTVVDNEVLAGRGAAGHRAAPARCASSEAHVEQARHTLGERARAVRHQHARVPPAGAPPGHRQPRPARRFGRRFKDRQTLVVVRGVDYREDLVALQALGLPPRGEAGADRRRRRRRRAPASSATSPTSSSATSTRCPRTPCAAAPSSSCTPISDGKAPGRRAARRAWASPYEQFETRGHERGHRHAAGLRARAPS